MKKRQKNILTVAGLEVLFTAYARPSFDKDAFIAGEKNGEATYNKYLREIPIERVTVRLQRHSNNKVVAVTINRILSQWIPYINKVCKGK